MRNLLLLVYVSFEVVIRWRMSNKDVSLAKHGAKIQNIFQLWAKRDKNIKFLCISWTKWCGNDDFSLPLKRKREKRSSWGRREARKGETEWNIARGMPENVKLCARRSRETRKYQTQGETIRGKPENENLRERGSREARERETQRMTLAGSPQKGFLTFDARGSPARAKI